MECIYSASVCFWFNAPVGEVQLVDVSAKSSIVQKTLLLWAGSNINHWCYIFICPFWMKQLILLLCLDWSATVGNWSQKSTLASRLQSCARKRCSAIWNLLPSESLICTGLTWLYWQTKKNGTIHAAISYLELHGPLSRLYYSRNQASAEGQENAHTIQCATAVQHKHTHTKKYAHQPSRLRSDLLSAAAPRNTLVFWFQKSVNMQMKIHSSDARICNFNAF